MLKRFLQLFLAVPIGIVLVALAIANRHNVPLILDPFRPEQPILTVELPFFAYLLGTLVAGVLLGGLAVWMSQSHWRRAAKSRLGEARRWRAEADRLTRERDAKVAASENLMLPQAGE